MIDTEEQSCISYIRNNKDYLKEFHNIYFNEYKKYLSSYYTSDYVITKKIRANEIIGYNDYDGFVEQYLMQLSEDLVEAEDIYKAYYEAFAENMENEIQWLQKRFNKTNEDLYKAYEIKTMWQFYTGFLVEKLITMHIEECSECKVVKCTEDHKRYLDNRYAIDIEVDLQGLIGIQSKSVTYLNVSDNKKDMHLEKHKAYKKRYNARTFYILNDDYKPCYYVNRNGEKMYLIESEDIKKIKVEQMCNGTYEGLIKSLRGLKYGN